MKRVPYKTGGVTDPIELRRDVLRRVRYATNVLALEADSIPPEGPFDAALTNGLLAIVASEFPGRERAKPGSDRMLPASGLLDVIDEEGGLACVDAATLREGLELTQPVRHGRADDEFAVIVERHVRALEGLDNHASLRFLETAKGTPLDECVVIAFRERAEEELPWDPKDRLETPDPDYCDECGRETFLRQGWDIFGGDDAEGFCLACGYELTPDAAYDRAVSRRLAEHLADGR